MIIIGLGNRARHGKDTAAEAIIAHAHKMLYPTLKYSWAQPLRDEVNEWLASEAGKLWVATENGTKPSYGTSAPDGTTCELGFWFPPSTPDANLVRIPDWVKPTPNPTATAADPYGKHSLLLQWWGTDYRRVNYGWNYWVNKGQAAINAFGEKHKNGIVLVPDTRFENELDAIYRYGGITIQCNRRNEDGTPFRDAGRDPNHPSETELDNANWQHKIVSKHAALTAEIAITIFEFERGLRGF